MIIKKIIKEDYMKAVKLKVFSFDEEVQGIVPNNLSEEKQAQQMEAWVESAKKYDDTRLLYGAYEGDEFLGFVGASIAEEEDSESGFELNYLFVDEKYRGKGISLKLLHKLVEEFSPMGLKEMIVYNYSVSPSNKYYRKLGGKVISECEDFDGKLHVDVFSLDVDELKSRLEEVIKMRYV